MKEILGYQVDEVEAASRMASLRVHPHCLEFHLGPVYMEGGCPS